MGNLGQRVSQISPPRLEQGYENTPPGIGFNVRPSRILKSQNDTNNNKKYEKLRNWKEIKEIKAISIVSHPKTGKIKKNRKKIVGEWWTKYLPVIFVLP